MGKVKAVDMFIFLLLLQQAEILLAIPTCQTGEFLCMTLAKELCMLFLVVHCVQDSQCGGVFLSLPWNICCYRVPQAHYEEFGVCYKW